MGSELETASPELLAKRALLKRQDWKFLLPAQDLEGMLSALHQRHRLLRVGPPEVYRTV